MTAQRNAHSRHASCGRGQRANGVARTALDGDLARLTGATITAALLNGQRNVEVTFIQVFVESFTNNITGRTLIAASVCKLFQ